MVGWHCTLSRADFKKSELAREISSQHARQHQCAKERSAEDVILTRDAASQVAGEARWLNRIHRYM